MHQIPLPVIFLMRPTGDEQKGPPKMIEAWETVKGPDMQLAYTSASSSWSIKVGWILTEGRLLGIKIFERGGRVSDWGAIGKVMNQIRENGQ